jgi:hypothetical protein
MLKKQQTISMQMFEYDGHNTHSALAYTMLAHAQLCAAGLISGLATRVTVTSVKESVGRVHYLLLN